MRARHRLGAVQIGDGARHAQHPVIAARGQPEAVGGAGQQLAPASSGRATLSSSSPSASALTRTPGWSAKRCGLDARAPRPRGRRPRRVPSAGPGRSRSVKRHRRHLDPQVEAVHQRAGDAAQIVVAAERRAGAGAGRVGQIAASAGVGRRDQHEPAGIADMGVGARHHDSPVSIGWRRVSSTARGNSGKFVHEQHAVMGQADLAGLGALAAADDGGHRGGVMRVAERAAGARCRPRRAAPQSEWIIEVSSASRR